MSKMDVILEIRKTEMANSSVDTPLPARALWKAVGTIRPKPLKISRLALMHNGL